MIIPRTSFGDSPAMATELAELVVEGKKTATCSAYTPSEVVPRIGDRAVVVDGQGRERCVIETMSVTIQPFEAVDAAFARAEGEGDLSLDYWRREHQEFFVRNGGFSPAMMLVCERFRVVEDKVMDEKNAKRYQVCTQGDQS
jgi:uncharacterized protein YhfF